MRVKNRITTHRVSLTKSPVIYLNGRPFFSQDGSLHKMVPVGIGEDGPSVYLSALGVGVVEPKRDGETTDTHAWVGWPAT